MAQGDSIETKPSEVRLTEPVAENEIKVRQPALFRVPLIIRDQIFLKGHC
jgi:hypothetical protein